MEKVARHNHNGVNADKISYTHLLNKPSPASLRHKIQTLFETAGRFVGAASGTGSARTFDTEGMTLTSGTSSNAYAYNEIKGDLATLSLFDVPLDMSTVINWSTESDGTHRAFVVVGSVGGTGTTYSEKHFGFQLVANASDKVLGTVGDGSNQTTVVLDTSGITLADDNIYSAEFRPGQGVNFYINGKRVGVINDITALPKGVPTDTAVWSEQKTIRDNSGSANTIIVRSLNIDVPLAGMSQTKL